MVNNNRSIAAAIQQLNQLFGTAASRFGLGFFHSILFDLPPLDRPLLFGHDELLLHADIQTLFQSTLLTEPSRHRINLAAVFERTPEFLPEKF